MGSIHQTMLLIQLALSKVRLAYFAAAVGTVAPGAAARRIATGATLASATSTSGSGLPRLQVSEPGRCAERVIERISRVGGRRGAGRTPAEAIRWSVERRFTRNEKIEDTEPRVIAEKYREYTKEDDKWVDRFIIMKGNSLHGSWTRRCSHR